MPIYHSNQIDEVIARIKEKSASKNISFGKVLSLEEIVEIENKYKIEIPEAYRKFLIEVGDGCEMLDECQLCSLQLASKLNLKNTSIPFPFENEWIWEDEENPSETKLSQIEYGNIELIDIGCSQTFNLIITGRCRGEIWSFCDVGIQPCCERQDFLGWFEKWLECGEDVDYFEQYPY